MKGNFTIAGFAVGMVFLCVILGIVTYVPEREIKAAFESIFTVFKWVGIGLAVFFGLAGIVLLLAILAWALPRLAFGFQERKARIEQIKAEAEKAKREASLVLTVAPAGSPIIATTFQNGQIAHNPLHYLAPDPQQWALYNMLQSINKKRPEIADKLPEVQVVDMPLPDYVDLSDYANGVTSLRNIFLGVGRFPDGQIRPVRAPLDQLVHIATGGSSGFGKSTMMLAIAYQVINAREAVRPVMLDAQAVTFTPFAGDERLMYPIASEPVTILTILLALAGEMKRRQQLFSQWRGVSNLSQYNALVESDKRLPSIPVFLDEFGLLAKDKKICRVVDDLAKGGRKAGISLIAGAQTWGHDEISTSLRANLSTSIQFHARDKAQSRILLGDGAAAEITQPGRAYAVLPGIAGKIELQAPDTSHIISAEPELIESTDWQILIPEEESKDDLFIRLVEDEGLSRSEASMKAYNKPYKGGHVSHCRRVLGEI